MVTLDDHPGLDVQVVVNKRPLQEYDDEEAGRGVISKYIEAISGKEFALRFAFTRPFPTRHGIEIRVCVDGEGSRVLTYTPEELYKAEGHYKRGVGFHKDGQWYRQNYCFTALNIVEEVEGPIKVADLRKDLDAKGSIKLEFRFITGMRESDRAPMRKQVDMLSTMGAIPEKALKGDARSHQATLALPRKARPRRPGMNYTHVEQSPFVTVLFKYRSMAALKALRVVSDELENDMPHARPDLEDAMTPGQLREALRQARQRKADTARRLKRERDLPRPFKRECAETADNAGNEDEITIVETRSRKRPRDESEIIVLD